jgi:hypothetical protein
MVAQACNPSYLGGGDHEDHSSRPAQSKFMRPHLNKWLGTVAFTCHPRYVGKHK